MFTHTTTDNAQWVNCVIQYQRNWIIEQAKATLGHLVLEQGVWNAQAAAYTYFYEEREQGHTISSKMRCHALNKANASIAGRIDALYNQYQTKYHCTG
jgi:hypothetical protein